MGRVQTCAGPLFMFPVPDENGGDGVALAECGHCGAIFVTCNPPDARHLDTLVVALAD